MFVPDVAAMSQGHEFSEALDYLEECRIKPRQEGGRSLDTR